MHLCESSQTVPTDANPGRALLATVGLLVVAAAISYVVPAGFMTLSVSFASASLLTALGGIIATLLLGVLGFAYLRLHDVEIGVRRPTGREWAWIAGGFVVSLLGAIVFALLEGIFAVEAAATAGSVLAAEASTLVVVLAAVYFLLVVGPIEEFLFRGVVQGRLRQSFGPAAAIALASVGFALVHVPNFWLAGSDLLSLGVAVVLTGMVVGAAILGVVYERTANLTVVVVIHGLLNATLFALAVALGA